MLIDSSGTQLVCALAEEGAERIVAEVCLEGEAARQPIDAVVSQLLGHCTVADIYSIVVGIGPGSFIGTRTAISFANGFAAAAGNVDVFGVNSLAAIAAGTGELPAPPVLRDARRGQWYLWTDQQCRALDEDSVLDRLSSDRYESAVIEWSGITEPALAARAKMAGVRVAFSPGVTGEGLLRSSGSAQARPYVEPIYLRGFT